MIKLMDLYEIVFKEDKAEDLGLDAATFRKYSKMIDIKDYETFVKALKKNVSDPKIHALIKHGLYDGDKVDDKVKYSTANIPIINLRPTQNEIDADKSLKRQLDGSSNTSTILDGGTVSIGGPIIIAEGKYIIDGHHRWSQAYAFNKDCKMPAINLEGIRDWKEVLKTVQLAIAADIKTIPVAEVKGRNLLSMSKTDLERYLHVNTNSNFLNTICFHDTVKKRLGKKYNIDHDSDIEELHDVLIEYLWTNISVMQKKCQPMTGAGSRAFMPQTGDAPSWLSKLSTGAVNHEIPYLKTTSK